MCRYFGRFQTKFAWNGLGWLEMAQMVLNGSECPQAVQAAPSDPKRSKMAQNGPKLVSQPIMVSNGFTTYNGLKRSHNLQLYSTKEQNWIKTFNLSSNEIFFGFRGRRDWKRFVDFFIIRIRMNYVSTFSWCKLKVGIKKHFSSLKKSRYHYWYLPTKVYMIGSLSVCTLVMFTVSSLYVWYV